MIDTLAPCVRGPIPPKEATLLIVEDSLSNFVLMARTLAYMGMPRCDWTNYINLAWPEQTS